MCIINEGKNMYLFHGQNCCAAGNEGSFHLLGGEIQTVRTTAEFMDTGIVTERAKYCMNIAIRYYYYYLL